MTAHFDKNETLEVAIDKITKISEISVREGATQLVLSDKNISETKLPIPMLLSVGALNSY